MHLIQPQVLEAQRFKGRTRLSTECVQEMIITVLSVISYLRNLFPDNVFSDQKYSSLMLKKINRGVRKESDQFLNWIERGCFEALSRHFLKSILLGIYTNPEKPTELAELFTIDVEYSTEGPKHCNEAHFNINASKKTAAAHTLSTNRLTEEERTEFDRNTNSLFKKICLVIQKLGELPSNKWISMRLLYSTETPPAYQPPFFQDCSGSYAVPSASSSAAFSYSWERLSIPNHSISFHLQTTAETKKSIIPKEVPDRNTCPLSPIGTSPPAEIESIDVVQPDPVSPDIAKLSLQQQGTVRCCCDVNENDLGMILCDQCGYWLHVVCMGYLANEDKRIPAGPFECYYCRYNRNDPEVAAFILKTTRIRRSISIILHEGFLSPSWFADRLGLDMAATRNIMNYLLEERFLIRTQNSSQVTARQHVRYRYEVSRNDETKSKIRQLFTYDISKCPGFPHFDAPQTKRFKQSIVKNPILSSVV